ncbi:hypothetical protein [Photobacterium gaetbulicola]
MSYVHGIHLEVEHLDEMIFMELKAVGTLTHEDYQKITRRLRH